MANCKLLMSEICEKKEKFAEWGYWSEVESKGFQLGN